MKKYLLEVVVFTCGAMIMIIELLAARILSPYVGSSNTIWTSIIGVILLSMSLGYWWGGKLADKQPDYRVISTLILSASIFVSLISIFETTFIKRIALLINNMPTAAILSATIAFSFPSFLLATISPYAIKLKQAGDADIGKVVGRLSALSTLGSIVGTFLGGFFLIPSFGNKVILFVTALVLYTIALILHKNEKHILFILFIGITIIMNFFIGNILFKASNPSIIADIDSEYSRIWVMNYNNEYKVLKVDTAIESYTDSKGKMGAKYLEYYDLFEYFNPSAKDTLIIGGAAYTYPTHYLNKFSDKNIDVVEIDPKMTELAKKYFNLKENSRLNIYHQDGRGYINKSDKKYDTVLVDAFKGYNVPVELTTKEAFTNIKNMLNEDGMVIANVISALDGKNSGLIKAQCATFKEVFGDVKLFAVSNKDDKISKQNLILIGFKTQKSDYQSNSGYSEYLLNEITDFNTDYKAFTDDYAPVEKYI